MKKKPKEMARSRKPDEKKLKNRFPVSLNDTDFTDFEDYKTDEGIDENSTAARKLLRWALQLRKSMKEGGSASSSSKT
jgi:hypothetical protein